MEADDAPLLASPTGSSTGKTGTERGNAFTTQVRNFSQRDETALSLANKTPEPSEPCLSSSQHLFPPAPSSARRWSTLDEYRHLAPTQNWVEQERKFLRLEALHQQQGLTNVSTSRQTLTAWPAWFDELRTKTWTVKSYLLSHKRRPTWGQYKWTLPFTAQPSVMSELLYSRAAVRVFGSIVAILFTLLGVWLCLGSMSTVSFSISYTGRDGEIVFKLHSRLAAPIFVYTSISGFWQNARDFVNSQPSYLGRGYSCHGLTNAKQFCAVRPFFHPPLLPYNTTFCDLPPETRLEPCGMNALWTTFDTYSIKSKKKRVSEPETGSTKQKKSGRFYQVVATVLKRNMSLRVEDVIRADAGLRMEEEKLGPEDAKSSSTTSIILGLETLRDILGWDVELEEQVKDQLNKSNGGSPISSTDKPESGDSGDATQNKDLSTTDSNDMFKTHAAAVARRSELEELKEHLATSVNLRRLAAQIERRELPSEQVRMLLRVLQIVADHGKTSVNTSSSSSSEAGWRPIVRALLDVVQQKPVDRRVPTISVAKARNISSHYSLSKELDDAESSGSVEEDQDIPLRYTPEIVLSPYQRQVSYPKETQTIQEVYARSSAVPWLPANNLRWFVSRRPAATSSYMILAGRIDKDLEPGVYSITCISNS